MHRDHPHHPLLVDVGHEIVRRYLAELSLLDVLFCGRLELGVLLAAKDSQLRPLLPQCFVLYVLQVLKEALQSVLPHEAVSQEPCDVIEDKLKDVLAEFSVGFKLGCDDGQDDLLEEGPQNEVLVVALEEGTHLSEEGEDLVVDACLHQGQEHVAEVFLVELLEEVLPDVDEVLDVLGPEGEPVEEEVEAVVPPLVVAQQLHHLPQDQVLLLLIVADPDIRDFLDEPGSPEGAQVVVSGPDGEDAQPDEAALELGISRPDLFVL